VSRFEIHILKVTIDEIRRLSDTIAFGSDPELADAERVFSVHDPKVHLIHVGLFEMTHEVLGYYTRILQRKGLEFTDIKEHLTYIVPAHSKRLPDHLCLTQLLLYSPKSTKQIL